MIFLKGSIIILLIGILTFFGSWVMTRAVPRANNIKIKDKLYIDTKRRIMIVEIQSRQYILYLSPNADQFMHLDSFTAKNMPTELFNAPIEVLKNDEFKKD